MSSADAGPSTAGAPGARKPRAKKPSAKSAAGKQRANAAYAFWDNEEEALLVHWLSTGENSKALQHRDTPDANGVNRSKKDKRTDDKKFKEAQFRFNQTGEGLTEEEKRNTPNIQACIVKIFPYFFELEPYWSCAGTTALHSVGSQESMAASSILPSNLAAGLVSGAPPQSPLLCESPDKAGTPEDSETAGSHETLQDTLSETQNPSEAPPQTPPDTQEQLGSQLHSQLGDFAGMESQMALEDILEGVMMDELDEQILEERRLAIEEAGQRFHLELEERQEAREAELEERRFVRKSAERRFQLKLEERRAVAERRRLDSERKWDFKMKALEMKARLRDTKPTAQ
ncbi:uncharacterized protein EV422DRAFT_506933 [Fimicolochytrium jonesii]|uniref:uncharacterized protein n=1 Tax=Fimicolochytrium jonesii TaxID=1396493 RepID=UPI0022FED8B6|nr:uncharacterized protein EV422DRAFT_506933 [Fimicolochytrium jonesii]KAI8820217.1 hypothetical protein EV422DRAFT_506933 [Fimicolochytrium jonesii]